MKRPVVDYRKVRLSNITEPEYRHLLLLSGWLWYLCMYFVTENLIPLEKCHVIHSPVDDLIPFNEWFVFAYVSWYVFLVGTLLYFLFYDVKSFVRASRIILGMQIIAVLIYLFWPSIQLLRPDHFEHRNICTWILGLIYYFDTPTGVCPSLHVGYTLAIMSAWLTRRETMTWVKVLFAVWSALICASVCFVKQHSFTDVWTAVVMYLMLELFFALLEKKNRTEAVDRVA